MDSAGPPSDVLLFGEVLFDHFPDGSAVLGGAPFNVAWGLQALGARPLLVSRVGDDDAGERVRARMEGWGLSLDGLQSDPEAPTGEVRVAVDGAGQPTFSIPAGQAWDRIDADAGQRILGDCRPRILYHGSLALRAPASRQAWTRVAEASGGARVFLDLNLRPPWWNPTLAAEALGRATWVKLNEAELSTVAPGKGMSEAAEELLERGRTDVVFVTLGAKGAVAITRDGSVHQVAPPALDGPVVDTVGAGDAFSAAALLGLLRGWPPATLLSRAVALAARICRFRGATPAHPDLYRNLRQSWEESDEL